MLLVFLAIGIILLVVGYIFDDNCICEPFAGPLIGLGGGATIILAVLFIGINLICLINGRTLDEKIAMYECENAAIEEEINTLVENYMKYETDTYESLKGEDGITLISLYPELKADTLVNQQCELYISNKEQITSLKEEQINLSNYKFWLYFGK